MTWEPLGGQCGGGKHGAQLGSWHPIQAGLDLDAPHGLLDALQEGPVLGVLVALPAGAHVGEGAHIGVEVLFTYWLLEDRTRLASPARGGPCPGRPRGSGWGAEGDEATPTQHCLPLRSVTQEAWLWVSSSSGGRERGAAARPGHPQRRPLLTMCGRRMLARLWMRAWLRPDSSRNRASFCSSMSLFSCSMVRRLFSMEEICIDRDRSRVPPDLLGPSPAWGEGPAQGGAGSTLVPGCRAHGD